MDASTFPIPFGYHMVFCIVAGLFFLLQFIRLRRPYQLVLAVAMPASLLIYIDASSKAWFHTIGIFEAVLLIGAIVLSILTRAREKKQSDAAAANDTSDDSAKAEI